MSAREALPTALALSAPHAPRVRKTHPVGALIALASVYYSVRRR